MVQCFMECIGTSMKCCETVSRRFYPGSLRFELGARELIANRGIDPKKFRTEPTSRLPPDPPETIASDLSPTIVPRQKAQIA